MRATRRPSDVDGAKQLVQRREGRGRQVQGHRVAAAAAAELVAATELGLDMSLSGAELDERLRRLRADIDAATKAGDKSAADDKRRSYLSRGPA